MFRSFRNAAPLRRGALLLGKKPVVLPLYGTAPHASEAVFGACEARVARSSPPRTHGLPLIHYKIFTPLHNFHPNTRSESRVQGLESSNTLL